MRFASLKSMFGGTAKGPSNRRAPRHFKGTFDRLEDRRMLATWWVGSIMANFASIQGAIDSASVHDGDTLKVQPGTYAESISVTKSLTILGGQPRNNTQSGPSIVESDTTAFSLEDNKITVKNFTIRPDTLAVGGVGIATSPNYSSYQILNNIIDDFATEVSLNTSLSSPVPPPPPWGPWGPWGQGGGSYSGSYSSGGGATAYSSGGGFASTYSSGSNDTVVSGNRFIGDYEDGILSDLGVTNVRIEKNIFQNGNLAAIKLASLFQSSNVQILSNQIQSSVPILVTNLTKSKIESNSINNPSSADPDQTAAILLGGGVTYTTVARNSIVAGAATPATMNGIELGLYDPMVNNSPNRNNSVESNTIVGNLTAFLTGILVDAEDVNAASDNNLYKNTIQRCVTGIALANGAAFNAVTSNTATLNAANGIELEDSDNNQVVWNISNNNSIHGIKLIGANLNNISGNQANFNSGQGISIDPSHQNRVSLNTANYNGFQGIFVNGDWNTISYNTASFNGALSIGGASGIWLDGANNNTVTWNVANNNSYAGISLYGLLGTAFNNTLFKNTTNFNTLYGIDLYLAGTSAATGNKIVHNTATFNGLDGISLDGSDGNTIMSNIASNNSRDGIHLHDAFSGDGSDSNQITSNVASNNLGSGIYIEAGSNNLVKKNTAKDNSVFDLDDDTVGGGTGGTDNTWENNIFGNSDPAGLA